VERSEKHLTLLLGKSGRG